MIVPPGGSHLVSLLHSQSHFLKAQERLFSPRICTGM